MTNLSEEQITEAFTEDYGDNDDETQKLNVTDLPSTPNSNDRAASTQL